MVGNGWDFQDLLVMVLANQWTLHKCERKNLKKKIPFEKIFFGLLEFHTDLTADPSKFFLI